MYFQKKLMVKLYIVSIFLLVCGVQAPVSAQLRDSTTCNSPDFYQMREYFIDDLSFPGRLAVDDLNNDSRPDLIIGELVDGGATTMSIMLGIGNFGGFAEEINYTISGHPLHFTTADLNNDGNLDIINTQFSIIDIYLGNGDGTVQTPPIVYNPSTDGLEWLKKSFAKDLNNDGNVDLITIANENYPGLIFVRHGNGDGTFNATQTISLSNFNFSNTFLADLNNDGRPDLLTPGGEGPSRVMFGQDGGTFAAAVSTIAIVSDEIQFLDANSDGYQDVVSVGLTTRIYLNDGQGRFSAPITATLQVPEQNYISSWQVADFTGDGIFDIAAATTVPDIRIYKGNSLTSFTLTSTYPQRYTSYSVRTADFNNDGRIDFTAGGYDSSSIYALINKCGSTQPTHSLTGFLYNSEGFSINSARVLLDSTVYGTLSNVANFGIYEFVDLPAGNDYTITPQHSLFNFNPPSKLVSNLQFDQNHNFEGTIRRFSISGVVAFTGANSQPAEGVPMRLVGPYETELYVETDSQGRFEFSGLYPIDATTFYQIQFLDSPIFFPPIRYYAIRGLTQNRTVNLIVSRYLYSVTANITKPNGQPHAGVVLIQDGTSNFRTTDQAGSATFTNLQAGLDHRLVPAIPSLRFTPGIAAVNYLSGNSQVEMRSARRNLTDFDNDGKTDLAVWRPETADWFFLQSSDNQFSGLRFGLNSDIPVPADYDGDQKTDIAVFRPTDGTWHFVMSSVGAYQTAQFGAPGDIPVPADVDRDGKTDFNIFRPSTGDWFTFRSYYRDVILDHWGIDGDRPLTGDFDGDTYNDRVVFRPTSGVWYVQLSSTGGFRAIPFGLGSDKALTGDFDGDTISDIAVWRPETGVWYIQQSSDDSTKIVGFGLNGDLPTAGDFDGDGLDDISVFRPSERTWFTLRSSDNGFQARYFGLAQDIPVPSMQVR